MRHVLRSCLRRSIPLFLGVVIAACSALPRQPDVIGWEPAGGAATVELSGVNAVRMRVARKAFDSGDYDVAARFYRMVADAVPSSADPLLGLGKAELALGKLDAAESAFRDAVLLSPDAAETNEALGGALVSQGAFAEAIQHFRRALASAPSAELHNKLGVAHDLMGDGETAQSHYRTALEMHPESVTARNNLALSLAISERYPEAIAEMERVAARPGATQRHRQNLAFVYGMAGRLDDAERLLARTDGPESERSGNRALVERIRGLAKTGDRADVLDFLRSAKPGSTLADQMATVHPAPSAPKTPPEASENAAAAPTASMPAAKERKGTGLATLSPAEPPPEPATERPSAASADARSGWRYRLQLAAYRSERTAKRGREILLDMVGQGISGLEVLARRPRSDAGGIDYRLRTPAVTDHETGQRLCAGIAAAGHPDCLVILHNAALWQPVPAGQPLETAAMDARYRVQLACYRTEESAVRGRETLSRLLGDDMKELEVLVKRSHAEGSKSIDFTLRTVPLESRAEGERLCDGAREAGHPDCLVIRHSDTVWARARQQPSHHAAAAETR